MNIHRLYTVLICSGLVLLLATAGLGAPSYASSQPRKSEYTDYSSSAPQTPPSPELFTVLDTGPKKMAGIHFGPIDAVEEKVEELDKKANEHWKNIWDPSVCGVGDTTVQGMQSTPDCNLGIPSKVLTYWRNHPPNSPDQTAFAGIATAAHTKDSSGPEADTVATTKDATWSVSIGDAITSSPSIDDSGTV
ncbi:MAG: hypothetical protein ABEJ65_11595, partial [bacterium]